MPAEQTPRFNPRAMTGWWLAAALAWTGALALSCAASDDVSKPSDPVILPAGSAARAKARAQREARAKAKAEQEPDKSERKPKRPPRRPKPRPKPKPEPAASAAPSAQPDAGAPEDAGAEAVASASSSADAGRPPLCEPLCKRFIDCMLETFAGNISDPDMLERMRTRSEEARESCVKECEEKKASAEQSYIDEGYKCMELKDCDPFMSCVRDLRNR